MGRVNRLSERRALRRAADQALLTSLGNPADQAGGAPDQDFTYTQAGQARPAPVVETSALDYDHDPVTSPIPVLDVEESVLPQSVPPWEYETLEDDAERADVYDLVPGGPAESEPARNVAAPVATAAAATQTPPDYRWIDRDDDVVEPPARPLRAPAAQTPYVRPELDFAKAGYGTQQWYRTKPAAGVLAAALVFAVVCGGWLVFRSPGTSAQESRTNAPTSAAPAPSNAIPTAVSAPRPKPAPPPLPPPPPPPPPAEPTYSAPQRQYQPRYSEPSPTQKPRVDVTRAPMSVAPVPKPVPGSDSNTPGDSPERDKPRRRGCFGFC